MSSTANANGLAVASIHTDKKHLHVHIMLSGNEQGGGRSTALSRKEFYDIREEFERYQIQQYPHLKDVVYLPEHKREQSDEKPFLSDAEYNLKKRGHNTDKKHLQQCIEKAFEAATSRTHFTSLLQGDKNIEVYEYREKPAGLRYNGRKYRFSRLMEKTALVHRFEILDRLEELAQLQERSKTEKTLQRGGYER